jgi:hypothetical protein
VAQNEEGLFIYTSLTLLVIGMPYHLALDVITRIEDTLREPPNVLNYQFV